MPVHTWGLIAVMDIHFWCSGLYNMKQRQPVVFIRNACIMQRVCMISIQYNSKILKQRGCLQPSKKAKIVLLK